ncbi:MAG TPA: permease-like cell division protein FtsX [Solirubrobacterales bacterium]|jgi:cell division transport system permease protein|nr:permease-like cell division protein FtsX [Solirubrobacterales bacterium]
MGRITFFLSEAFRALRRSAAPSVAAIVTVAVTTLLLGVLVPVLRASESKATDVQDQIGLEVFLYKDATHAEIDALEKKLVEVPHVTGVEFISPAAAKDELARDLEGDLAKSIGQLNQNPLPPSFDLALDDPDNLESVRAALSPPNSAGESTPISPIIDPPIGEDREQAKQIREVTGALKIVLIVIAALLLVASLLLIANTIRLSIYARRREVEVMRLVGATNWFIRWPFVIEGVVVGVVGAAIAVAILWLGKVTIVDPLADNFALVDNLSTTGFLPLVAMLLASAVMVSALGSGITLRRFLRI